MKNKISEAFDEVKAGEELKEDTLLYLRQYDQKLQKTVWKPGKVLVSVCILLMISLGGMSYKAYVTPVSYMDIDVNPSVELVINRFGRVIDAAAYNDDGIEILDTIDIKHKSYDTAVTILIDEMEAQGYLSEDGLLSVTVQSDRKEREILDTIRAVIDSVLAEKSVRVKPEIYAVDTDTRTHAHASGVSPAKYLAIAELMEVDDTATFESCQGHSISELREYTQGHHGSNNGQPQEDEESDTERERNSGHHGNNGKQKRQQHETDHD